MKRPYKLWAVTPDLQLPYEDKKSIKAVNAYLADEAWDGYLNLGDFMDFNGISKYNEGRPGSLLRRKYDRTYVLETLDADYGYVSRFLDEHVRVIRNRNAKTPIVILEGNHDFRVQEFMDRELVLKDSFDLPKRLHFDSRNITWWPYWTTKKLYRIQKAHFLHGKYTTKNHAMKTLEDFGVNCYYGHVHDCQSATKMRYGHHHSIEAASLGCLCRYDQHWKGQDPTKWQQAMTVFYFLPDGTHRRETAFIINHSFVGPTNGKVYDGNLL